MLVVGLTLAAASLLQPPATAGAQRPAAGPHFSSSRPALRPRPDGSRSRWPEEAASAASALVAPLLASTPLPVWADGGDGRSALSYYTVLTLFLLSFPGIFSLVKRSVKSKVVRKTYEVAGPAAEGGRPTRELAGDIVAFFQANNYKITDAGDTIVFEGLQGSQFSKAAFLTFCTFLCIAALALVLTIVQFSFDSGACATVGT